MSELAEFLRRRAGGGWLDHAATSTAVTELGVTHHRVEETALEAGLLPLRYQRNNLSPERQLRLFRAGVVVIGCGGLGGYVIEELARVGVGRLTVVDPDRFEEHNLNRQILATTATLGRSKAEVAAERVAAINPAVEVRAVATAFGAGTGRELLDGASVVVDGLDSIPDRLALASCCQELALPLVHGAVAGWYGRIAVQPVAGATIADLYPGKPAGRGVEAELGVLPATAALVASLEVAEVVKLLLGEGRGLTGRCLSIDTREMEFVELGWGSGQPPGQGSSR